jgi:hypothetical protein
MNYDLPELPFIPGSLVSDDDDEKETGGTALAGREQA